MDANSARFRKTLDPWFQPWTGGGEHFSFFNQPAAAEANFHMFCRALRLLLDDDPPLAAQLDDVRHGFPAEMKFKLERMWASKLGLARFDASLFSGLFELMQQSRVDYTLFFRALCDLPTDPTPLVPTFHTAPSDDTRQQWQSWLDRWHEHLRANPTGDPAAISSDMKRINPRYTWREWLIAPAYEQAEHGDYTLVRDLQWLFSNPYTDQPGELAAQADQKRPPHIEGLGGVCHMSCSS